MQKNRAYTQFGLSLDNLCITVTLNGIISAHIIVIVTFLQMASRNYSGSAIALVLVLAILGTLFWFGAVRDKDLHDLQVDINSMKTGNSRDSIISVEKESTLKNSPTADRVYRAVPKDFNNLCGNLFKTEEFKQYNFGKEYNSRYKQIVKKIGSISKATSEGSSGTLREQSLMLHFLAQGPGVKTICETGFNVGYSSFTYLAANPDVVIHSFDLGKHPGTKPMAKYLQSIYGNRLNLHYGDSTKVIPAFYKANPTFKCDFIFVDGGHGGKVPWADIQAFDLMAIPGKTIMMFDDYPTNWGMQTKYPEMGGAWELAKHYGMVNEIFQCNFEFSLFKKLERGFTVGLVTESKKYPFESW